MNTEDIINAVSQQLKTWDEEQLIRLFGVVVDAIGEKNGVDIYEAMKGDLYENIETAQAEEE